MEELPANSFVCNLVTELGFDRRYDPPVADRLRFSFLTVPTVFDRNYFAIDERSGVIHTTERIDREQLCPGGVIDCVVQYDVAVKPMEFFEIVKVCNDNSSLRGFRHNGLKVYAPVRMTLTSTEYSEGVRDTIRLSLCIYVLICVHSRDVRNGFFKFGSVSVRF